MVYSRALKSRRKGHLNLAHGTKNSQNKEDKLNKNKSRVDQTEPARWYLLSTVEHSIGLLSADILESFPHDVAN